MEQPEVLEQVTEIADGGSDVVAPKTNAWLLSFAIVLALFAGLLMFIEVTRGIQQAQSFARFPRYPAISYGITAKRQDGSILIALGLGFVGPLLVAILATLLIRSGMTKAYRLIVVAIVGCSIALTAIVGLSGKLPSSSQPLVSIAPGTGFGGYNWFGDVNQISAQWQVPTIASNSPPGHASTWIGAQSVSGNNPFIQLGTTEDNDGSGQPEYQGFWSDVPASFHPQYLGEVSPDDMISASMVRQAQGWSLNFIDRAADIDVTKFIPYATNGTFAQAEWLQEDPTASNPAPEDLPYPEMSTVQFQQLIVNGKPPQLDLADAKALSAVGGVFLEPTAEESDGFSFRTPTGAAAQYLSDAYGLDHGLNVYQIQMESWASTSTSDKEADVRSLLAEYSTQISEFASQSWPTATEPSLALLVAQMKKIQGDIKLWISQGLTLNGAAYSMLTIDQRVSPLSIAVRATLGLPPP